MNYISRLTREVMLGADFKKTIESLHTKQDEVTEYFTELESLRLSKIDNQLISNGNL
jgi:hypothetical protein